MGRRIRVLLVSLGLGFASLAGDFAAGAETALTHPGRIVEMGANAPLSDVVVKAWPESRRDGTVGDCPTYGKSPLASTTSEKPNGRFTLEIDAARPTYTTTYCVDGYFPRADLDISNKVNGSPVMPVPVGLVARKNDAAAYGALVKSKVTALLSDLAYLASAKPEAYSSAMSSLESEMPNLPPSQRAVLSAVRQLSSEKR